MEDGELPEKVEYHITISGYVPSERIRDSLTDNICDFVDKLANSKRYKNLDIVLEDE